MSLYFLIQWSNHPSITQCSPDVLEPTYTRITLIFCGVSWGRPWLNGNWKGNWKGNWCLYLIKEMSEEVQWQSFPCKTQLGWFVNVFLGALSLYVLLFKYLKEVCHVDYGINFLKKFSHSHRTIDALSTCKRETKAHIHLN